jgi:uncharacterized protein with PQ loop repeat
MAFLKRIRVPLEIFLIAMRPFSFSGISCKAYMELPVVLYNFASSVLSKFLLFLFVIEIAVVNLDVSSALFWL